MSPTYVEEWVECALIESDSHDKMRLRHDGAGAEGAQETQERAKRQRHVLRRAHAVCPWPPSRAPCACMWLWSWVRVVVCG